MTFKHLTLLLILFVSANASAVSLKRNAIELADKPDTWTREIKTPQILRKPLGTKHWSELALLFRDLIDTYEGRTLLDLESKEAAGELQYMAELLEQECRSTRTRLDCAINYEGERLWNGDLKASFVVTGTQVRRIRSLSFSGSM